jgi:hypothetical protein
MKILKKNKKNPSKVSALPLPAKWGGVHKHPYRGAKRAKRGANIRLIGTYYRHMIYIVCNVGQI